MCVREHGRAKEWTLSKGKQVTSKASISAITSKDSSSQQQHVRRDTLTLVRRSASINTNGGKLIGFRMGVYFASKGERVI